MNPTFHGGDHVWVGVVCGWWPRSGVRVYVVLPDSNNIMLIFVVVARADRKLLGCSIKSRP